MIELYKIRYILTSKWNSSISISKARKSINTILPANDPSLIYENILADLKNGICKTIPQETFYLTSALLCLDHSEEELVAEIKSKALERHLFKGFEIFLCGTSGKSSVNISWSEHGFKNKLYWVSKYSFKFDRAECSELFAVARMLDGFDSAALWSIALKDPNDLLLFGWLHSFNRLPSADELLMLLTEDHSERRHALALWLLTFPCETTMEDEKQARNIMDILKCVPGSVLFPRMFEMMLTSRHFPSAFSTYLTSPGNYILLRKELDSCEKISTWSEAISAAKLLNFMRNARRRRMCWKQLISIIYNQIIGGYMESGVEMSQYFLAEVPDEVIRIFKLDLSSSLNQLHTEGIDSIVRHRIWQHDIYIKHTIEIILKYCEEIMNEMSVSSKD